MSEFWRRWGLLAVYVTIAVAGLGTPTDAQSGLAVDPKALIDLIVATDMHQRDSVKDVTFDAQYVEGEETKQGFKEKARFTKRVMVKYLKDTAWFHEEYLEYYKEGELQSKKDCANAAKEKMAKKKRRKSKDVSYNLLESFYPDKRDLYEITYKGIAGATVEGRTCHHFTVKAKEPDEQLIDGDYYFESDGFHLVKVDFTPSKVMHSIWFNFSKLAMSITYAPTDAGWWLPTQFFIEGKAKATLFISVKFGGTEYYRSPVVNSGLSDSLFQEPKDE